MNASTKTFAILSLSAAIGGLMAKSKSNDRTQNELEMINWRGQKLAEAGVIAVEKYPLPSLTKSKLKQVEKKVDEVCKHEDEFMIVEKLAFLITALIDIRAHIKPKRWILIDPILTRANWAMQLFDSKYEQEHLHSKAFEAFERWAT